MHEEPIPVSHPTASLERLRDLRCRFGAEEARLARALAEAQLDFDLAVQLLRLVCIERTVPLPTLGRRCEAKGFTVEDLARELVDVRAALRGCDDEIAVLERRAAHALEQQLRREVAAEIAACIEFDESDDLDAELLAHAG